MFGRIAVIIGSLGSRVGATTAWARPVAGARFRVDLRDRIQCLMWAGRYERNTLSLLRALFAKGAHFLDVGAHVGYFSVAAAATLETGGQVHAFEPDPALYDLLRENLGPYSHANAWHAAVGSSNGRVMFFPSVVAGESGWGTVYRVDVIQREQREVDGMALDSWAEKHRLPRGPLVVKIDAEGAEKKILEGAQALIRRRDVAVLCETNEVCLRRDGSSVQDLVEWLHARTFSVWAFSSDSGSEDMLLALKGDVWNSSPSSSTTPLRLLL